MGSLGRRILLSTLLVALLAAVLTGVLVRGAVIGATEEAAQQNLQTDAQILNELQVLVSVAGSWSGAPEVVEALAGVTGQRIALTTVAGEVLADSDPEVDLPPQSSALIDPTDLDNLAFLDFEQLLVLDSVDLTSDARAVTEAELVEYENEVGECLEEAGVEDDVFFETESDDLPPAVIECFDDFEDLLNLSSAEPALLYLGLPADELVDFGSIDFVALLLIGLAVAAAAAVAATLLARRISTPVRSLTSAVGQLGAGDLTARADTKATGEIGALAQAFNTMAADLEEGEHTRQRMVRDVAHELRNPIGVLQGNLEAAQDGIFEADEEMLAMLHDETVHLSALVEDLQQLALADAGTLSIRPESTDLFELAEQIVSRHQPVAAEAKVELRLEGEDAPLSADPTRIRQVILNLVTNAVTYTPEGGRVDVVVSNRVAASEDRGSRVELIVADTGPGLSAEQQQRVFDRFWRADDSRNRHTGGAGLGLSICRQLVEAHGGTIEVASAVGEGSTFTVRLPAGLS